MSNSFYSFETADVLAMEICMWFAPDPKLFFVMNLANFRRYYMVCLLGVLLKFE